MFCPRCGSSEHRVPQPADFERRKEAFQHDEAVRAECSDHARNVVRRSLVSEASHRSVLGSMP